MASLNKLRYFEDTQKSNNKTHKETEGYIKTISKGLNLILNEEWATRPLSPELFNSAPEEIFRGYYEGNGVNMKVTLRVSDDVVLIGKSIIGEVQWMFL